MSLPESPVSCPACGAAMAARVFGAHMGGTVSVDVCLGCQAFWFDGYESLQLTPASTLQIFRIIGEENGRQRQPIPPVTHCPRCRMRLVPTEDLQRTTRFRYGRCPRGHGRLITFFDFLREKDFVRTLTPQQVAELRAQVQTVNCSNCGAPVDLDRGATCAHCGSPLSFFDTKHAHALIAQLRESPVETPGAKATLPIDLLLARREAERAFPASERGDQWLQDVVNAGTVTAGVMAFVRWLSQQV